MKVHPDCHVVIAGSFYSVPYPYVGQTLDADIAERMVERFAGQELVASHERSLDPGESHTPLEYRPAPKAAVVERTRERCRAMTAKVGVAISLVVETLLAERPLDGLHSA